MRHETDREEWSRIQRDEDVALQLQQKDAGLTHAPVRGPGPYGDHATNMAVEASVARERERCATVVECWAEAQSPEVKSLLARLASALRAQ